MTDHEEIGGFELLQKHDGGAMATVYVARQKALDRLVAVKIMHPHLVEDESLVARFMEEARRAADLRHPNIVQIIDCGREGDSPFIAMEFVEGRDLRKLLKAHGAPPLEIAVLLLRDISMGLEHAHEKGTVHRDIKPSNLMLSVQGIVKIMDFGLARKATELSHLTTVGGVLGTPAYMSPEQAEGKADVDYYRSDLFSLGIVAYELLSGSRPFQADSQAGLVHAITQVDPPPLSSPPVPIPLAQLIGYMLVKDPSQRCPNATTVRQTLESVIHSMGLPRSRDLLREYARDPEGCRRRLEGQRAKEPVPQEYDGSATVVHPPERPAGRPPEPPPRDTAVVSVGRSDATSHGSGSAPSECARKRGLPRRVLLAGIAVMIMAILVRISWNRIFPEAHRDDIASVSGPDTTSADSSRPDTSSLGAGTGTAVPDTVVDLYASTQPPAAALLINLVRKGVTPTNIPLRVGRQYNIRMQRDGYEPYESLQAFSTAGPDTLDVRLRRIVIPTHTYRVRVHLAGRMSERASVQVGNDPADRNARGGGFLLKLREGEVAVFKVRPYDPTLGYAPEVVLSYEVPKNEHCNMLFLDLDQGCVRPEFRGDE